MKLTALAAALVLLAGCAAAPAQVVTVTAAAPSASESPNPDIITPTPTPRVTSERGHAVKRVGDQAVLVDGNGEVAARFTVTKIEPGFKCTGEGAERPANGQFVGVWMDVTTTGVVDVDSDDPGVVPYFNTADWQVVGGDGVTENDSVGNGLGCARDRDALPAQLGAGEHVKGVVVLDVAARHGRLVLVQDFAGVGWEWEF